MYISRDEQEEFGDLQFYEQIQQKEFDRLKRLEKIRDGETFYQDLADFTVYTEDELDELVMITYKEQNWQDYEECRESVTFFIREVVWVTDYENLEAYWERV